MVVFVKIIQFLLSLTILVLVHELGHFFFAKIFKTKVEKFRIFFDYKFSLWKTKIGETDFGIGWIPLGGYVKIAGMIDESMDREQMQKPPQPWEFRSKPAWQRLMIMIGGVLFNLIFAWVLYSTIMGVWGDTYLPNKNVVNGVACTEIAQKIGFESGDKILTIYGEDVERFSNINNKIIIDAPGQVEVLRNGKKETIYVRSDEIGEVLRTDGLLFSSPRFPFHVGKTVEGSNAQQAGFESGDILVSLNGDSIQFFDQYVTALKNHKGDTVKIGIIRDNIALTKDVKIDSLGKMGIYPVSPYNFLELESQTYSFLSSIPKGFEKAKITASDYVKQLKLIFSPEVKASESLGGFISIGSIFPGIWNWEAFWELTAFLSILLAVMNILPIPALDGGHVIILLYEMITRRKPSQRFLEVVQIIGLFIILALVLFANINDVVRFFK